MKNQKQNFEQRLTRLVITLIKFYRVLVSPFLGPCCRFYPSCSLYAMLALEKYGLLKGMYLTVRRLARCHPWGAGGYDPV
ncbi:MAG: membrane protein insertion efficiency factor YidD [Candidatus Omnitrophica bacterium]|nr:membrane protein insertion efficiency factor YidD [Candidatus Omnitrophota bacterium]MCM8769530.1 membrane protein insertion efficiency factor YidD [Candidatus Omnitrophota bacterium]